MNKIPGLIIAGTSSGSGKTTISSAIMALLSEQMVVQPFKVGPDYIDPQFHTAITGRYSRNLDSWLLTEEKVKYLFKKNCQQADIAIVEGVMGLFDGFGISNSGSTASLASILKLPVIITLDGRGVSTSIAATVKGFSEFDSNLKPGGVIFNKLHGVKHYNLLKSAVEKYTDVPVLGYLNYSDEIALGERHLGLIPQGEVTDFRNRMKKLKVLASQTLDLEKLRTIASKGACEIDIQIPSEPFSKRKEVKIAVPYDAAFNFYYRDNLDFLEENGARLVYFSPLQDKTLPSGISGIILGGGFPEVFAHQLRRDIMDEIKGRLTDGMPCYAECGGFMYLCNRIVDFEQKSHQMAGFFEIDVEMTSRLQRFGYVKVTINSDTLTGKAGTVYRAHEFHRSKVLMNRGYKELYSIKKSNFDNSISRWSCGYSKANTLAGYPHLHFYSAPETALTFIEKCRIFSENQSHKNKRNNKS